MRLLPAPADVRRRLPRVLAGLVLCGLGIALMVAADLGLAPWDVLHQGLARLTGIPIGRVAILTGAVVLLLWIPLHERPGIGTLLNVVIVGLVIDGTLLLLGTPASLGARFLMMLTGSVLFGLGTSLYVGGGLGSGPRDGVMTGLARRGVPIGVARAAIELTVLLLGWSLGGTVGIGTVIHALGIGPLVHLTLPWLRFGGRPDIPPDDGLSRPERSTARG